MELKIQNLSKAWRGFNLRNINLTIGSGEYFILLGPTGAGKTLLLETIMGFHKPNTGKIILDGVDLSDFPPEKRGIGYVPQNCVLFPNMNVRQNIEFGLKVRHVDQTKRDQMVEDVMDLTGLASFERRQIDTLSGGERQKVALARVLAIQPKIILLDEPLTGMDAGTAREFRRELKRIHKAGETIVQVTHNQIEAFSLGDRIGIIREGEIVQTGESHDVISNPRDEYVARFLGYENVFKAQLVQRMNSSSLVRVENANLEVGEKIDDAECIVAFRPEDVKVNTPQKAGDSVNVFEGTVVDFSDQGHFVAATFDAGIAIHTLITRSAFIENHLEIGAKVNLTVEPHVIKVLGRT